MNALTGMIFDIRRFSIHDGPGIRTTVFLKGCPLTCQWCHNPESQSPHAELIYRETRCIHCGACVTACPQAAIQWEADQPVTDLALCACCGTCADFCPSGAREIAGERMSVDTVISRIQRDIPFYDESGGGVTFSGGEPLQQRSFLQAVLRACHALDIHTAVDTCGFAPWDVFDSLRADVNLFLYDLKLMESEMHRRYTGVSNELILENLRSLASLGHAIQVRVPLIPGVTDTEDNLRQIAEFVGRLDGIQRVDLLPYHEIAIQKYNRLGRVYSLAGSERQNDEQLQAMIHIFASRDVPVCLGG